MANELDPAGVYPGEGRGRDDIKRDVAPTASAEETTFDARLRPKRLSEFVGQQKLKDHLAVFLGAAQKRGEPIEHTLLYGNPGLGKTTLAHIITREMGANIKTTSGPALERVGDLAAILTNLEEGDVLFIDEIHRLNKLIEEVMYPAMEDFALDLVIGKGPSARTLRMDLPRFTLIGATTRLSLLTAPLRDRFGVTYHLDFYEPSDLTMIIERNAVTLGCAIRPDAAARIAERARRTPRVANRLLKRVRDYADFHGDGTITVDIVDRALLMLEIDAIGLDSVDRRILETVVSKFAGGPVGLNALAAATSEEMETIETIYEPYLIQLGLLHRTPRGRMATEAAYKHLGLAAPQRTETMI
ncbi:MAG: Holliday junction branch migration DNA helicase RuvB [Patescibacteria group bacterium]